MPRKKATKKAEETITLEEHNEILEMLESELEGGNQWYVDNMLEQVSLKMLDNIEHLRQFQKIILETVDNPNKTKEEVRIAQGEASVLENAIDTNLNLFVQLRANINPELQKSLFR